MISWNSEMYTFWLTDGEGDEINAEGDSNTRVS
jgi:hypothetical protein